MGGKMGSGQRLPLEKALAIAYRFKGLAEDAGAFQLTVVAGSLRRFRPEVGDIDLVVLPGTNYAPFMKEKFGEQKNGKPARSGVVEGVQVDVLATDEEGLGAALCHFTGPAELNVQQRAIARARGFKLNEKGLWRGEVRIAGRTEEEVYAALGMTFILPQMRDDAELEY